MLSHYTLDALQQIVNYYLKLDPELLNRLDKLEKKILAIDLKNGPGVFYIQPSADGLIFYSEYDGFVDTHVSGSLTSFISMSLKKSKKPSKDISITGDIEFGQAVKDVLDRVEIDWEYYLSNFVGDVVAHQVGNSIKEFINWGKKTTADLVENTKEYLQEETRHLPPREEFEDFCDDVSDVCMTADRLEARLKRISTVKNDPAMEKSS